MHEKEKVWSVHAQVRERKETSMVEARKKNSCMAEKGEKSQL
jgi:hypothetical protein